MAKSQLTFEKRQREKRQKLKKLEKQERREYAKHNNDKGKSLTEMLVYVDANGNLTDTPPKVVIGKNLN